LEKIETKQPRNRDAFLHGHPAVAGTFRALRMERS
jgi:hypothetical protein